MWILLLLPFVGLLWVPFFNFLEPSLFGFPFSIGTSLLDTGDLAADLAGLSPPLIRRSAVRAERTR